MWKTTLIYLNTHCSIFCHLLILQYTELWILQVVCADLICEGPSLLQTFMCLSYTAPVDADSWAMWNLVSHYCLIFADLKSKQHSWSRVIDGVLHHSDRPMDLWSQTSHWCWCLPLPVWILAAWRNTWSKPGWGFLFCCSLFIYLFSCISKKWNSSYNFNRGKKPHSIFNPVKDQQHLLKGVTGHRTGLDDL